MKKILSIILSVAMVLSMFSVAFAQEDETEIFYDYEIKYGETITIEAGPETPAIIKFVPEEDMKYVFSATSDEMDTYCFLYKNSMDEFVMLADNENDLDFVLKYKFEAGEEYYFEVYICSEDISEFEINLECGHKFEESKCTVCGNECDHSEIEIFGTCPCGAVFLGTEIEVGKEYEVKATDSEQIFWFKFIPEESGAYSFKSITQSDYADPDCLLYDSNSNEPLSGSYDVVNMDFDLIYNFEAGETYYFDVHNCFGEGAFKVVISFLTHTADDGSVHASEFVEGTDSNCTEHGYTDGLYCEICDKFVLGHEERELNPFYHIDEDFNAECDRCGEYMGVECECICHSENPFFMFIWKIANFFHGIFGFLPECECGEMHY